MSFAFALLAPLVLVGVDPGKDDLVKKELEKLQGTWILVAGEGARGELPEEEIKQWAVTFEVMDDKLIIKGRNRDEKKEAWEHQASFKIEPSKKPKWVDLAGVPKKGETCLAIYELEADTLKICLALGKERPTEFRIKPNLDLEEKVASVILVLKRKKP